ncbi:ankyrin repeat domain-containing protein [Spongiimicrobium salis]|uniref:ankyrin repeat domain-containing protein n=1 Tax=Spongiimicrobium salis TaxID=1667022 RepID=UPI00374D4DCE
MDTIKHNFLFLLLCFSLSFSSSAQNIYRTACQGNLTRLDSLLQNTAIDTVDQRGRSLVHWAVACKQKKVFDFLVARGAATNLEDKAGDTPLFMAVRFNNEQLFDTLLQLQTSTDWTASYGASLLEKAILNKNLRMVQQLIAQGVDIHILNDRGSTPLEIALRTQAKEISAWLLTSGADSNRVRHFQLNGPYLGQKDPGLTPQRFAPNFISTEEYEFGSVFNAAGTEFYYGVDVNGKAEIRYSKRINDLWTFPKILLSHERYGYNDPFLSPDENRLYFISERALDGIGDLKDYDIWYVERIKEGWSQPINAGPNINSDRNEYYISFTKDGTMYFSSSVNAPEERKSSDLDIYASQSKNGTFQKAVSLGNSINTPDYEADVFVDPEERYVIFCGIRPEGLGRGDLYISFKNLDGTWTKAASMGEKINTEHHELCPFVSKDGKYFFYTSNQDIYWVSTKIIDDLAAQYRN